MTDLPITRWRAFDSSGYEYIAEIQESEPGVYYISADLMHELLHRCGYVQIPPKAQKDEL